MKTKDRTS